jgi:hypothetical protein
MLAGGAVVIEMVPVRAVMVTDAVAVVVGVSVDAAIIDTGPVAPGAV